MRDAIEYEVDRHIGLMERNEPIVRETRGWDTGRKMTYSLRDKEQSVDYRFMRDADLPPVLLSEEDIAEIRATLVETPAERVDRYCRDFGLTLFDAEAMALEPAASRFFEAAMPPKGMLKTAVIAMRNSCATGSRTSSQACSIRLEFSRLTSHPCRRNRLPPL